MKIIIEEGEDVTEIAKQLAGIMRDCYRTREEFEMGRFNRRIALMRHAFLLAIAGVALTLGWWAFYFAG